MRKPKKYSHWIFPIISALLFMSLVTSYYVASQTRETTNSRAQAATPTMTVLAKNLEIPWALDFLPDGNIIFTERPGRVKLLNPTTGVVTLLATIPGVKANKESGLLGIALHPQFATNNYVYIYYTYATGNRVERYTLANNQLTAPTTIIDAIPANDYHNGGRIRFGPDGYLYVTTGDATVDSSAQDTNSLGGKILRVKDDGTAAPGNPFNNRTYSYGHRNPQGIAWDGTTMYATEHGPSQPSCCDELNKIEMGKNYGWPDVQGDATKDGTVINLMNSGTDGNNTWAPSGTAFYNGSVFFAGLKGEALYEAKVNGTTATIVTQHFKNQIGRVREAIVGPDNQLYITTSNKSTQGGSAQPEDDKIIKLNFGTAVPSAAPSPTVPLISPTYNCLGPCPTVDPALSPTAPASGEGTISVEEPTVDPNQPTTAPEPTVDPCADTASVQHWGKHHKKHNGGIGNFMQQLLELLKQLLELIGRLLGGGGGDNPEAPTPTPCEPTAAPEEPEPTAPATEPTTATGVTPTTGANPTTGAGTGTPNFMLSKLTGYGWPDNDPPGGGIAYPGKHQKAGGTGTYEDPITFATATSARDTFPAGMIVYIPHLQKYFIMEDSCAACNATWMDLWVNSNGTFDEEVQVCEDSLTIEHSTPDIPVVLNAPAGLTVNTTPLFDLTSGTCNATNQL